MRDKQHCTVNKNIGILIVCFWAFIFGRYTKIHPMIGMDNKIIVQYFLIVSLAFLLLWYFLQKKHI